MLRIDPNNFAEGIAHMDRKITLLRCMGFDTYIEPDREGDYFVKMRFMEPGFFGGVEPCITLPNNPIKPLKEIGKT